MPEPDVDFSPSEILRVLAAHEVRYVVIGGLAATLHGSPYVTFDVDITPEKSAENLERLSTALRALGARLYAPDEPEGLPFSHTGKTLGEVVFWNLVTSHGRLDVSFLPSGTEGFADLARDANRLELAGVHVVVASLADVIRSKAAADRPKDHVMLPTLRDLLDRLDRDG